jgi:uncharacterized protein YbaR (Trm112 family)
MTDKWYEGPWKVIPETSMTQRARLKPGEIMKHKSGTVLLNCPACNSLQFAKASVISSDILPSLDRAIQCGSGFCKRCGVWFRIIDGKTIEQEKQNPKTIPLPKILVDAGVTKQKSLAEEIRKIRKQRGE